MNRGAGTLVLAIPRRLPAIDWPRRFFRRILPSHAIAIVDAALVLHFPRLRALGPELNFLEDLARSSDSIIDIDQRWLEVMAERGAAMKVRKANAVAGCDTGHETVCF